MEKGAPMSKTAASAPVGMAAATPQKPDVTPAAQPLNIAVIGHQGRMGAMLCDYWAQAGHTVRGADRGDASPSAHDLFTELPAGSLANAIPAEAMREAVQGADAVALCVPAQAMPAVLSELAPFMTPAQLLFDITSVKVRPMLLMERYFAGPVVGTHPLFGPVHLPEDLHVALTPGRQATEAHLSLVRSLFECFGCSSFITSPEEHDRSVAFVQGLNFVSSAAYFASLAHREELLPFLTPSFRRRLDGARKLLTEDAGMFQGFTSANPMTRDAIHTFRLFLDLVERGGLADVARQARWWYQQGDGEE
jgi:prephenate dehydrogenase